MKAAALILVVLGGTACGSEERTGSQLTVTLLGSAVAFSRASIIEVQETRAGPPTSAPAGEMQMNFTLCTNDRKRFLTATTVTVRVVTLEGQSSKTDVQRIACRLSENPGPAEHMAIRLQDDGTINSRFGEARGVETYCYPPNSAPPCPVDTL